MKEELCIFELDSKLVVDAIYGERGSSIFHAITDECVILLKHFREVLVWFEYRCEFCNSLVSTGCVSMLASYVQGSGSIQLLRSSVVILFQSNLI